MPTQDYRLKSGKPVYGVTTIMDQVLAKPALIYWAFTQGMENYEKFVRMILTGINNGIPLEEMLRDIRGFKPAGLYEKRDKAADAGTLGHALIEHDIKGLPEPDLSRVAPEAKKKAEGCYLAFTEWKDRSKFKLIHSEIPLVSEKHEFGGCLDVGGSGGKLNELELIDLKTSKGIYYSMWIQVAGYAILWDETHPDSHIMGYNVLRIGPEGNFMHERWVDLTIEKEIFLFVNEIHKRLKAKGVKL